jgi:hypothetical protein
MYWKGPKKKFNMRASRLETTETIKHWKVQNQSEWTCGPGLFVHQNASAIRSVEEFELNEQVAIIFPQLYLNLKFWVEKENKKIRYEKRKKERLERISSNWVRWYQKNKCSFRWKQMKTRNIKKQRLLSCVEQQLLLSIYLWSVSFSIINSFYFLSTTNDIPTRSNSFIQFWWIVGRHQECIKTVSKHWRGWIIRHRIRDNFDLSGSVNFFCYNQFTCLTVFLFHAKRTHERVTLRSKVLLVYTVSYSW